MSTFYETLMQDVLSRPTLAMLPGDWDANTDNFNQDGKPVEDKRPTPADVDIKKGFRLHLTRNLGKEGDFVNGMECTVAAWDGRSHCFRVRTKTGKDVAVHMYTEYHEGSDENVTFFPIRLGYASTICKMQGAELEHVTIYLDVPNQPAAAYVAMSRVRKDTDYLFGGKYTEKHFIPNA